MLNFVWKPSYFLVYHKRDDDAERDQQLDLCYDISFKIYLLYKYKYKHMFKYKYQYKYKNKYKYKYT